MSWIDLIGYVAGIFTLLNMIPQVIKTYHTKSCEDISYGLILTYAISMLLWVVYAYFIVSWPIMITNGISFFLSLVQFGLMLKYNKKTTAG